MRKGVVMGGENMFCSVLDRRLLGYQMERWGAMQMQCGNLNGIKGRNGGNN
jgi:hypothetical protein